LIKKIDVADIALLVKTNVDNLNNYELFLKTQVSLGESWIYPGNAECEDKQYVYFTDKDYILIEYVNYNIGNLRSGWIDLEPEHDLVKICEQFNIKFYNNWPKISEDSCEIQDEWGNILDDIFKIKIIFDKKNFLFAFLIVLGLMSERRAYPDKNYSEVFLNSKSLSIFEDEIYFLQDDRNKYVECFEIYINLEKFIKDLRLLKDDSNEMIITSSSFFDMDEKSSLEIKLLNGYTSRWWLKSPEDKRILDNLQLIKNKK